MSEEVQLPVPEDDPQIDPLDPLDEQLQELSEEREVRCTFRTGRAGTGKSFQLAQEVAQDPSFAAITATTGIAAVNLGAVTINSVLKYFNTESMRDSYLMGALTKHLHKLALRVRELAIDEGSMMPAEQMDYLYRGVRDANRYADVTNNPLGILFIGDFAQLPPVKARWAFESNFWEHFAKNTVRLEKVWRQGQGPFLDALNLAREGRGPECAEVLEAAGAQWNTMRDPDYDGTTILSKNSHVNRHNEVALDAHQGAKFKVMSRRWGKQYPEWSENPKTHEWGIPPTMELKIGAYVMIRANAPGFVYVNGDCGHVVSWDPDHVVVRLVRNGKEESIKRIVRGVEQIEPPVPFDGPSISRNEDDGRWLAKPHYRGKARKYVVGQIEFFPMQLAWASTVHKSQGLSLDRVQVDIRDQFWSQPAMMYVALSRCRTLEGLRIVGQRDTFAKNVNMDRRVLPWL